MSTQNSQHINTTYSPSYLRIQLLQETPMPLVTQVSPNNFLVTNIQKNLKVVCSHQETHHYIQKPNNTGTLEIILPCECSLHQEELTLINTVIPCGSKNPDNYQITHLLPISWSKFHSITILPLETETRQEFQHLHEILDENRTLSTPTYFVHNLQRQHHFQLKHDEKKHNSCWKGSLVLQFETNIFGCKWIRTARSMSWRENNIKTEEQGGEEEVEDGNSKTEVREC
ncbi:hypothetical protein J6590_044967 [Homalodisca vitripennis]|nr:hypothetical protein J6590_044967 [Homalodisca vitripennis]